MAKAVKQGDKWVCRAYNGTLGTQKRFYGSTKKEAERKAAIWAGETGEDRNARLTLQKAAEAFLEERSRVLSPNTIRGYTGVLNVLGDIKAKKLKDLTDKTLQAWVNDLAKTVSPKTVQNRYGFVTTVIRSVYPERAFRVRLPEVQLKKITMPSQEEINRLLDAVEGTPLEIPVLLAIFVPMRRGEISALTAEDIDGDTIHVRQAIAKGANGALSTKAPKTRAGDRYVRVPHFIIEKLPQEGKVTDLTPDAITRRFERLTKEIGFPYTFHQLRHWSGSFLHRAGLSEQEIKDRAGWESSRIFRDVYRHALAEKDRAVELLEGVRK
jgi:integrase